MNFRSHSSVHLVSHVAQIDEVGFLDWVKGRPEKNKFYLKLRDDPWEWAGAGNLFTEKSYSMGAAYEFIHSAKHPGLKMFVAHTFDLDPDQSYFALPRVELCRENNKVTVKINCWADEDPKPFLAEFVENKKPNAPVGDFQKVRNSRISHADVPDRGQWGPYFDSAQDFLRDHSKIVLARVTESRWQEPVDPFGLLESLNQQSYRCYIKLPSGQEIVSVSPERLFKIERSQLKTEAVAGTRPRDGDPDEFLRCPKERLEHQYVVDEVIRQISPFCDKVESQPTPQVVALKKVLHLKTPISGKLKGAFSQLKLIEALHPTPAVGGLPKKQSVSWLENHEPFKRQFYAAPVGVIGEDRTEVFVNIRSVLINGRDLKLYSGVGVVKDSRVDSEWDELDLKASQFWEALLQ